MNGLLVFVFGNEVEEEEDGSLGRGRVAGEVFNLGEGGGALQERKELLLFALHSFYS